MTWKIHNGDALETMRGLDDASFDAVLCDPPYGLSFMGKEWDHGVPSIEVWAEVLRVLKPGAFLLAFGGTRTFHRLTCAIEDAGFEIRDTICWLHAQGFPKNHSVYNAVRQRIVEGALCLCGGSRHSTSSTDQGLSMGVHTDMVHAPSDDGRVISSVPRCLHGQRDSQADYQRGHGLCGEPPLPLQGVAQAFAPSPEYAPGHTHWPAHDDAQASEPGCSPSPAQHIAHPSSPGSDIHGQIQHDQEASIPSSSSASAPLGSGMHKLGTLRSSASGLPVCNSCGKFVAENWSGFGTALKPAVEFVTVAMKPLDGTFAENALRHGVAGINVEAGRIGTSRHVPASHSKSASSVGAIGISGKRLESELDPNIGRWPANLILDREAGAMLDAQTGNIKTTRIEKPSDCAEDGQWGTIQGRRGARGYSDEGGASRFFYQVRPLRGEEASPSLGVWTPGPAPIAVSPSSPSRLPGLEPGAAALRFKYCAKASRRERDAGLDGFEEVRQTDGRSVDIEKPRLRTTPRANHHPCLKPLDLNRYLASLILPPERDTPRRILVPFSGSGSEIIGALHAGWDEAVGIELEVDYIAIAEARLKHWTMAGTREGYGAQLDAVDAKAEATVETFDDLPLFGSEG